MGRREVAIGSSFMSHIYFINKVWRIRCVTTLQGLLRHRQPVSEGLDCNHTLCFQFQLPARTPWEAAVMALVLESLPRETWTGFIAGPVLNVANIWGVRQRTGALRVCAHMYTQFPPMDKINTLYDFYKVQQVSSPKHPLSPFSLPPADFCHLVHTTISWAWTFKWTF